MRTKTRAGLIPLGRAADAAAPVFAALAAVRSARGVHPRGAFFTGTLVLQDADSPTVQCLGGPGEQRVLLRPSKAAGLPGDLPDFLGIALRAHVHGAPVDLLMSSVGQRSRRFLLAPSRGWDQAPYSTLLPYQAGEKRRLLGLRAETSATAGALDSARLPASIDSAVDSVTQRPLRFSFEERGLRGWASMGQLDIEAHAPEVDISFDPYVNSLPQFAPTELLGRLRRAAYAGSRRGRRGPEPALEANFDVER